MVKLSDIELPMIFKNRLLFSHGILNHWHIHAAEVTKSLDMTDWSDQKNRALFLSHTERDAQRWIGRIANPYTKNGELYGDLEIHDADLALKLGPGKAPLGVSAEIKWPKQYADPTNFSYKSFAMVPNPEVPETMVNFSEDETTDGEYKSATIHVPFKVSTTNFSEEEKVEEIKEEPKEEVVEEAKADLDETKEDLMSAERGFEKEMENNANDVIPEVKEEEVMETKVEEVVEEVEEEAKADFSALEAKFDALSVKVNELTESFAKFSESAEAEEVEEVKEVVEEAKAEFNEEEVEEVVEEPKEEVIEEVEEVKEEEANAEFSELASKIDKLADAISQKEAAPMSTAEFGANGNDKGSAVIDRLTKSLEN